MPTIHEELKQNQYNGNGNGVFKGGIPLAKGIRMCKSKP